MILLDTNVVSEGWRQFPDPRVAAWLNAQPAELVYLCTPVFAELRYGVERLLTSQRKHRLSAWVDRLETETYSGRVLPFDLNATHEFGRLSARRERIGRRMEPMDAMIATIALAHGAALATRDVGDFADLGLELIDPFAGPTAPVT